MIFIFQPGVTCFYYEIIAIFALLNTVFIIHIFGKAYLLCPGRKTSTTFFNTGICSETLSHFVFIRFNRNTGERSFCLALPVFWESKPTYQHTNKGFALSVHHNHLIRAYENNYHYNEKVFIDACCACMRILGFIL